VQTQLPDGSLLGGQGARPLWAQCPVLKLSWGRCTLANLQGPLPWHFGILCAVQSSVAELPFFRVAWNHRRALSEPFCQLWGTGGPLIPSLWLGVVVHTLIPALGRLRQKDRVQGQPGQCGRTLSQKHKKKQIPFSLFYF
jgi:hypothetical protein